jgi:hypothetical protein
MPIPAEIHRQRYISLATFRKTGVPICTPIWFAEEDDKIYFMTNSKLGKVKRIRNNPLRPNGRIADHPIVTYGSGPSGCSMNFMSSKALVNGP